MNFSRHDAAATRNRNWDSPTDAPTVDWRHVICNLPHSRSYDKKPASTAAAGAAVVTYVRGDPGRVDGTGFVHLQNVPSLQVLNLLGTVLDEEAFAHIAALSQLQTVYVDEPDTEGVLNAIRALYRDRPELSVYHSLPSRYCALCIPDY